MSSLLIVTNSASADGPTLRDYYIAHRPGASNFGVLNITCATTESTTAANYLSQIEGPVLAWLAANPSVRYVLFVRGIPTRTSDDGLASVDYRLWAASAQRVRITRMDMGTLAASQAYIDRLGDTANLVTTITVAGVPMIQAQSAPNYTTPTYRLDDKRGGAYSSFQLALAAKNALAGATPPASGATVQYSDTAHPTNAMTKLLGLFTWGVNAGDWTSTWPTDGSVTNPTWSTVRGWYLLCTAESFNGMKADSQPSAQGNFEAFFSATMLGGTGYSRTPIGFVGHVEEPLVTGVSDTANLFARWQSGACFADCAWTSRKTIFFAAWGDPFVSVFPSTLKPDLIDPTMSTPTNNTRALLIGVGRFYFSKGATSVANAGLLGYADFDNIRVFQVAASSDKKKHFGGQRGTVSKDRTDSRKLENGYILTCDAYVHALIRLMMYGTSAAANTSRSALAAAAGTAFAFTVGAPSVAGRWYPIFDAGGNLVTNLTGVTIGSLVLGTDFLIDDILGQVKFLTTQTTTQTPTITAPAITAGATFSRGQITPGQVGEERGFGRLVCFDEDATDAIVFDHQGFSCDVMVDAASDVKTDDYSDFKIAVAVTVTKGTIFTRELAA